MYDLESVGTHKTVYNQVQKTQETHGERESRVTRRSYRSCKYVLQEKEK